MIKESLMALDKVGPGRVGPSDLYGAHTDGERLFAESEEYLREI